MGIFRLHDDVSKGHWWIIAYASLLLEACFLELPHYLEYLNSVHEDIVVCTFEAM